MNNKTKRAPNKKDSKIFMVECFSNLKLPIKNIMNTESPNHGKALKEPLIIFEKPFAPIGKSAEKSALLIDKAKSVIKPFILTHHKISDILPKTFNLLKHMKKAIIKKGKK